MIRIGIDYSITSPALTILKNNHYHFISFFDEGTTDYQHSHSKKFYYHKQLKDKVDLFPYRRIKSKSNSYIDSERVKMKNANLISDMICNKIEEFTCDDSDVLIGIEGFSYGSKSSSTLDLVMYQSFLRLKLIEIFGPDCLAVISPSEIKKNLTGRGNACKIDMVRSFINRENDDRLIGNEFWNWLREVEIDETNLKPIDDLIDSYGCLVSLILNEC